MRSRSGLFDRTDRRLEEFQKKLLVDLELCLDWNSLEDSVVGDCFIQSSVIKPTVLTVLLKLLYCRLG